MAENLQSKLVHADRTVILSLLAENSEFRHVFLDDPFKALDKYNMSIGYDIRSPLRDIMNYLPSDNSITYFNEKLVLCSAAPA